MSIKENNKKEKKKLLIFVLILMSTEVFKLRFLKRQKKNFFTPLQQNTLEQFQGVLLDEFFYIYIFPIYRLSISAIL